MIRADLIFRPIGIAIMSRAILAGTRCQNLEFGVRNLDFSRVGLSINPRMSLISSGGVPDFSSVLVVAAAAAAVPFVVATTLTGIAGVVRV